MSANPMEKSVGFLQEVGVLQWKARNEPAMWNLLRRAAAAAAQATSISHNNEAMINQLAEDIIKRADTDMTVFKLLQHAASAARGEVSESSIAGEEHPPSVSELPAPQPAAQTGDMEKAFAEALGIIDHKSASSLLAVPHPDTVSIVSCDTDGPMPIIPIRTEAPRKTPVSISQAEPSPLAEVSALSEVPTTSEAFAERLKTVLDRYRAGMAGRKQDAISDQNDKLELLKAAFDAGALTPAAFADAVSSLTRPVPPANPIPVPITTPLPLEPKPLLSPMPVPVVPAVPVPVPVEGRGRSGAAVNPNPRRMMSPMRPPTRTPAGPVDVAMVSQTSAPALSPRPVPPVSPLGRQCRDVSPANRASQRSHSTRIMNARRHAATCLTPKDPGNASWDPVVPEDL
eukprot:TRINITY_DN7846_c0_g1_i1.p1 TRINITY_DN7846_c0_g1~~TRINITY_DN7846_c0_g1_i1.p1  ORF type:complete len:400 (+),score=56.81 TRINITY_DN7846_c0_g1_i1:63-1262(+)